MAVIIDNMEAQLVAISEDEVLIRSNKTGDVWADTAPKGRGPFIIQMSSVSQEEADIITNWIWVGKATIGGVEVTPQIVPGSITIPKPIPPLQKDVRYPVSVELSYMRPEAIIGVPAPEPTPMPPPPPVIPAEFPLMLAGAALLAGALAVAAIAFTPQPGKQVVRV